IGIGKLNISGDIMKNFNSFKKTLGFLTATMLALAETGCSSSTNESQNSVSESSVSESATTTETSTDTKNEISEANPLSYKKDNSAYSELFSDRDLNPDFNNIDAEIKLNGTSASCNADGVTIDGSKITITKDGIYKVSGRLDDGQIIVDAPDSKVQIILDNADISCSTSSAIYGVNSKKIFVSLAENSTNKLSDGENYIYTDETNQEPDSCIFSKDSLTINGNGSLEINSSLNGIHSKDDIVITGGNINITSDADGIKGKDYVAVADGIISIKSAEDGIKSTKTNDDSKGFVYIANGTFTIDSACDGVQAETDLIIDGGTFDITSNGGSENSTKTHMDMGFGGGGRRFNFGDFENMTPPDNFNREDFENMTPPDNFNREDFKNMTPPQIQDNRTESTENSVSTKGIKGGNSININGGNININSADDSVHSNGDITINAGMLDIKSGDKGIHADSNIKINNGSINIAKSYEGIESAVIEINNGNISLKASDDGLNASDGSVQAGMGTYSDKVQIIINGGYTEVDADGDGLDSNGNIAINGGTVIVNGSTSGGDGALDSNGEIIITGGTLIAAGMHDMAEYPDSKSTQCVISATFDTTQTADTIVSLKNSDGNDIITFTSIKPFDNIVISSPDILKDETYSISLDGAEYQSITINDTITTIGTQSTMGGFGNGMHGGRGRGNKGDFQPPTNENGEFEMPDKNFSKFDKNSATNL
ncbi:MAG: carbohydrate-binding domain-containing protein, partial [Ruminococcus sp.]|nr:carbohydrate-binding domain-containing protein [Ruminococcus sp.]